MGEDLANRNPKGLDDFVMVPRLMHTGCVKKIDEAGCTVLLDQSGEENEFQRSEVWKLKWKARRVDEPFLYIAKAWVSFGRRKIRIQKHFIHKGLIGRRIIILERVNGTTTRDA